MAENRTFGDRKYDKRVPYKPSPESKEMAEKYVAPAILAGMSLIPVGGGATGALGRLSRAGRNAPAAVKVEKSAQSGARRFAGVNKADKVTKMKTREGLERKDPMEPRVVESGRSEALKKAREGGGGVTKMKDRRGLEIKQPERKAEAPPSRGGDGRKVAKAVGTASAIVGGYYGAKEMAKRREARAGAGRDRVESTQSVQRSSFRQTNPTQRAYDSSTSPGKKPVARPQARPADLKTGRKAQDKSKTRIAFEKKFAKERAEAKRRGQNPDKVVFKFKGKKYNTKLAK